MVVTIPSRLDLYFRQRLELLRPFPPYSSLTNKELDVLAEIQYQYYLCSKDNKDLTVIDKTVFHYHNMLRIREKLDMSEFVLNNNKSKLRAKKFITDKKLNPAFYVSPQQDEITFKFIINDLEGQTDKEVSNQI